MSVTIKSVSIASLLFALGACGGSSGSETPTRAVVPSFDSRTGLPFATDDIDGLIAGLVPGEPFTGLITVVEIDQPEGTRNYFQQLQVSFRPDVNAPEGELTGTLVIGDLTYEFVNGVAPPPTMTGYARTLVQEQTGTASALFGLEENDAFFFDAVTNSESTFSKVYIVVGFETSAQGIASMADANRGTVFYNGEFTGFGELITASLQETVNLAGDVEIGINFGNGAVSGDVSITEISSVLNAGNYLDGDNITQQGAFGLNTGEQREINMATIPATSLDRNGFDAVMNVATDCPATCVAGTATASLGGVLYGVNANEVAGAAMIDFTAENDTRLIGVGGYIAPITPPR
ncbi:MAG: hypothetical protein NWQ23_10640 [Yoonia sp.]|uniref:hypothetical protein n=1 Tax=Yoonia sp. TaxID=2212373 RepID=UPI00273FEE22|nr:hypothetical protein [Yoonia sp.]MDP5085868.1 hypothetical protein [Yoonia sp.]